LDLLRGQDGPVTRGQVERAWHDTGQRLRCLQSLLDDGLVTTREDDTYALP
jgi:A/G-specific adenine glycosylase